MLSLKPRKKLQRPVQSCLQETMHTLICRLVSSQYISVFISVAEFSASQWAGKAAGSVTEPGRDFQGTESLQSALGLSCRVCVAMGLLQDTSDRNRAKASSEILTGTSRRVPLPELLVFYSSADPHPLWEWSSWNLLLPPVHLNTTMNSESTSLW